MPSRNSKHPKAVGRARFLTQHFRLLTHPVAGQGESASHQFEFCTFFARKEIHPRPRFIDYTPSSLPSASPTPTGQFFSGKCPRQSARIQTEAFLIEARISSEPRADNGSPALMGQKRRIAGSLLSRPSITTNSPSSEQHHAQLPDAHPQGPFTPTTHLPRIQTLKPRKERFRLPKPSGGSNTHHPSSGPPKPGKTRSR